jgi:hypothetical protein
MQKQCTRCHLVKSVDEFGKKKRSPDGLNWWCKQCVREYQVERYHAEPDLYREKSRRNMARIRATEEGRKRLRATSKKAWENGRRERDYAYKRKIQEKHFFVWRALNWSSRHAVKVTARDLARLWKRQRGRCALSGRKLGRDAHLDHIHAKANGGSHDLPNLRWVDPKVNVARQDMTDVEFVEMCKQVAEYIGRRIVEALTHEPH